MIFNIDVDNTVNNFSEKFLEYYNDITGKHLTMSDLKKYDLTTLGVSRETLETLFFNNNAFYRSLDANPIAIGVIRTLWLSDHTINFVTASDYSIIDSRIEFIKKYFDFLNVNRSLLITEDKGVAYADFVIDDLNGYLVNINPDCTYILLKKPWNLTEWNVYRDNPNEDVYACVDWNDIISTLHNLKIIDAGDCLREIAKITGGDY